MKAWSVRLITYGVYVACNRPIKRNGFIFNPKTCRFNRAVIQISEDRAIILDAFIGYGSSIVAAERQKMRWIGIDLSRWSINLSERIVGGGKL
jgi:tRNA G10  N-methylase Trm11